MKNKIAFCLAAASSLLCALPIHAQHLTLMSTAPRKPGDEARMKWFKEARFGMFIHWGIYSVPAGTWQGKDPSLSGEWIMNRAEIPVKDYKDFAKQFTASQYDPKAWADLAKEAGMKYVVITAKHHDGFALYDSAVSDWNAANASPAGRDLLMPLAEAVRANGLKFGLYYSQSQDWVHPGGAVCERKNGGPTAWDPAQKGDYDTYLSQIAVPQTREILTRYKPDIFWWDSPIDMTKERAKPFHDLLSLVPGIITNNRLVGQGLSEYRGDIMTPEQFIPPQGYPGQIFEVCMTMNRTWGYKKNDNHWKSAADLLQKLSDIASKGGNFLLNVGPTAEGVIPPESVERLKAMGQWMKVNGEAIYATEASPFPRRPPWGRITRKTEGEKTLLYLHVWDWPKDGKILLPTLKEEPVRGYLLKNRQAIQAKSTPEGIWVLLPDKATDPIISLAVLEFNGPLTITQQPDFSPGANGQIELDAYAADLYGGYDGTIQVEGTGESAHLAHWSNARWGVKYVINTLTAQKWEISAELIAPKTVQLLVKSGNQENEFSVPATGDENSWKTQVLGNIELPAGRSSLELKGVPEGWAPVQLSRVTLKPIK